MTAAESLDAQEVVTTNRDAWNTVDRYRDELNANGRKIAFAGAALAWTLQKNGEFPWLIGVSLIFFVLFFSSDLIQLFVGYFVRRSHMGEREVSNFERYGEHSLKADYSFYRDIDNWPYRWQCTKWVLLCVAYVFLLSHMWSLVDPFGPLWKIVTEISAIAGSTS